jgi:hypothetical protein
MNDQLGPYQVVNLAPGRRIWINVLHFGRAKSFMYGLLEVDVTVARQIIAEHKARTGETLSFTGFLTICVARTVDEDKSVQAHLKGRKQLVLFDDVHVGLMIERKLGEKHTLMGHVVRRANRKTFREIHDEIRAAQNEPLPANRGMPNWLRTGMLLPWPLSRVFSGLLSLVMNRDPTLGVAMAGTVAVTAVGMFGEGHSGWGLFPITGVLGLIVGSIAWKPGIVEGRVEPREILHLTVMFDHDIVDGGPAARFTHRLVELIESGYGLDEFHPQSATGSGRGAQQPVPALG